MQVNTGRRRQRARGRRHYQPKLVTRDVNAEIRSVLDLRTTFSSMLLRVVTPKRLAYIQSHGGEDLGEDKTDVFRVNVLPFFTEYV